MKPLAIAIVVGMVTLGALPSETRAGYRCGYRGGYGYASPTYSYYGSPYVYSAPTYGYYSGYNASPYGYGRGFSVSFGRGYGGFRNFGGYYHPHHVSHYGRWRGGPGSANFHHHW